MPLGRWQTTVVDDTGDVLPLATLEVRNEATGLLASLFSDRDGTVGIANPLTCDAEGFGFFFVTGGSYQIVASNATATEVRTWRYVPIGTAAERDVNFTQELTPPQITANQNDYDPTDLDTARVLRSDADQDNRTFTGLAGGEVGRRLTWVNVGSTSIILSDEDTASVAANRLSLGGVDTVLCPGAALELFYDAVSSRWRIAGSTPESAGLSRENLLINSDFQVWQRGVGPFTLTEYGPDRWRWRPGSASNRSLTRQAGLTENSEYAAVLDKTDMLGASDVFEQRVEDVRHGSGQRVTVSYLLVSNSGGNISTVLDLLQHNGSGGSADVSTADQTIVATTNVQRIVSVIDVPSAGPTIGAGSYLSVRFVRGPAQDNGEVAVGDFKMEVGCSATAYVKPPLPRTLRDCFRYYRRLQAGNVFRLFGFGMSEVSTRALFFVEFIEEMRASPSMGFSALADLSVSGDVTDNTPDSFTFFGDKQGGALSYTKAATFAVGDTVILLANNTLSAYIDFDSEL